jgi:hypothetical protein
MPARKAPAWTAQETAVLVDVYPREGINGATGALPERSWHAIEQRAHKLGLRSPIVSDAPSTALEGDRLEEAIRLREEQGWSFARIGAHLGVCEASACNAVLIALCPRKGFTPAQRDKHGRLLPEGMDRLRYMLRKGLKGVDIQLRLGLSASRIALERRRYSAELKANRKMPLPPPGGGEAYSGVKLTREKKREAEQLLLEGFGAKKVSERTGVSHTSIGRIRNRLIKRLGRRGETLPGCDRAGQRRSAAKESTAHIPVEQVTRLRSLLLERVPVARAAKLAGIGSKSAYRLRDELAAELATRGAQLLPPIRAGAHERPASRAANWLPSGQLHRFRKLTIERGLAEAEQIIRAEIETTRIAEETARRAEQARPKTFEEQLARVARGEVRLVRNVPLRRPDPSMTLGGIATGSL